MSEEIRGLKTGLPQMALVERFLWLRSNIPLAYVVRRLALAITALALLSLAVLAGTILQQQREQDVLASGIEAARQSFAGFGDSASNQQQQAKAQAELATEQAAFPSRLSGPGTVGALIQLAEESGLKVINLKTQPGREQQVGEHTYGALSVHIQVEGTVSVLRTFVGKLERGALQAVRVDELTVTGLEQLPTADLGLSAKGSRTTAVQHSMTASLEFSVYARD